MSNNSFQVTLTSDSSLNVFTKNSLSEFTVLLPETLTFENSESWGVAVKQLIITPVAAPKQSNPKANTTTGELESPMYIYLDILDSQVIGNTLSKVALILPPAYMSSHYLFENPTYLPLGTREIRTVNLSIRDKFNNKYPLPSSHVSTVCVLHFKQIA